MGTGHNIRRRWSGSGCHPSTSPELRRMTVVCRNDHKNQSPAEATRGSVDIDRPIDIHSAGSSLLPHDLMSGTLDRARLDAPQGIWGNSKSKSGTTNIWL